MSDSQDRALARRQVALNAAALRHANNETPDETAIEDLRRITGEHTELLTAVASQLMNDWLTDPSQRQRRRLRSVWLLLAAGADAQAVANGAVQMARQGP